MTSRSRQTSLIILTLLLLAALACQLPQSGLTTPTQIPATPQASQTGTAEVISPHPSQSPYPTKRTTVSPARTNHFIATHRVYGIAGFYDRRTSQSFIPRGVNYAISVPILDHYEDRLFASGFYDHNRTQADFSAISAAGYNTVRISLDGCLSGEGCIGTQGEAGLNPAYLDNIVDLMNLARGEGLFLLLTSEQLPILGEYASLAGRDASQSIEAGRNAEILTPAGIQAAQHYWSDLLEGLIARDAPLEIVLGWELIAEQYYRSDQAPFSLKSGKVVPANGQTYVMSQPASKADLAVDGLRFYIDQLRQTILAYDPTALVTMGFFPPNSPNAWLESGVRMSVVTRLLQDSNLDFFDLHAYPGDGLSMAELAQNFGLSSHVSKPIVMGEAGAYTWTYPQVSDGVIAVQDWIAESCSHGFSGWLYRGYYPDPAGLPDATWGFVDEKNTILVALSPKSQPDACSTTVLPGRNLALGRQVSVSGALPDQTPQMAVDGDPLTQWSAGGYPMQWIEIDLGATYAIGEIRLTVGQWPDGNVVHQLWLGSTAETMKQVHEFSGYEYDFDVLSYVPESPMGKIRYVRLVTSESPSWVSWREIEVLAPFPKTPTPTPEASTTPTP